MMKILSVVVVLTLIGVCHVESQMSNFKGMQGVGSGFPIVSGTPFKDLGNSKVRRHVAMRMDQSTPTHKPLKIPTNTQQPTVNEDWSGGYGYGYSEDVILLKYKWIEPYNSTSINRIADGTWMKDTNISALPSTRDDDAPNTDKFPIYLCIDGGQMVDEAAMYTNTCIGQHKCVKSPSLVFTNHEHCIKRFGNTTIIKMGKEPLDRRLSPHMIYSSDPKCLDAEYMHDYLEFLAQCAARNKVYQRIEYELPSRIIVGVRSVGSVQVPVQALSLMASSDRGMDTFGHNTVISRRNSTDEDVSYFDVTVYAKTLKNVMKYQVYENMSIKEPYSNDSSNSINVEVQVVSEGSRIAKLAEFAYTLDALKCLFGVECHQVGQEFGKTFCYGKDAVTSGDTEHILTHDHLEYPISVKHDFKHVTHINSNGLNLLFNSESVKVSLYRNETCTLHVAMGNIRLIE